MLQRHFNVAEILIGDHRERLFYGLCLEIGLNIFSFHKGCVISNGLRLHQAVWRP